MSNFNTPVSKPVNDVIAWPAPEPVAKAQSVNKPVAGKKLSNSQQTTTSRTVLLTLLIMVILAILSIVAYWKSRHS